MFIYFHTVKASLGLFLFNSCFSPYVRDKKKTAFTIRRRGVCAISCVLYGTLVFEVLVVVVAMLIFGVVGVLRRLACRWWLLVVRLLMLTADATVDAQQKVIDESWLLDVAGNVIWRWFRFYADGVDIILLSCEVMFFRDDGIQVSV